jgi:hypothetical protein
MYKRVSDTNDTHEFYEDHNYFEECYKKFVNLCQRKDLESVLVERNVSISRKPGFFVEASEK